MTERHWLKLSGTVGSDLGHNQLGTKVKDALSMFAVDGCCSDRRLIYKPLSLLVVSLQLAGAAGAADDGESGEQKQQPAEEEAAVAQAGHPNHPADARRLASAHPGDCKNCVNQ